MNKDLLKLVNSISSRDRENICKEILSRDNITTYEYLYLQKYSGMSISNLFDKYPSHGKYVNRVNMSQHYSIQLKNPCRSHFINTDTVFKDDLDDKYSVFKQMEWSYKFPSTPFINCEL